MAKLIRYDESQIKFQNKFFEIIQIDNKLIAIFKDSGAVFCKAGINSFKIHLNSNYESWLKLVIKRRISAMQNKYPYSKELSKLIQIQNEL